ncbi:MAG: TGS domain-containing protein [bacterium]
MPANLSPEYLEAEKNYRQAKTPEEKLRCLEYMLSVLPKHKGTEKIQADLKKKIAKYSREEEKKKKTGASRRSSMFNIPREGAGQVSLVGPPNSGKSSVLAALTNAPVEVADYPYTTMKPQPGMAPYENIKIQLVDLPPISADYFETWIPGVIRNSDMALLVLSLASDDVLEEADILINRLRESKLELKHDAQRKFFPDGTAHVKSRVLCTHADVPEAAEVRELLSEVYADNFEIWNVSLKDPARAAPLVQDIYNALDIVRVYTKSPGKQADLDDPVTLPRGSTVIDFAYEVHKDLARNLKYARVWGKDKNQGRRVPRDYELADEDVVELHD